MTKAMQEHLLRGKLSLAPLARPHAKALELAEVPAPSLEGLQVEVTAPAPMDEEELVEALRAFLQSYGKATYREVGDAVVEGDEVLVDLMGYNRGRVVPMSSESELWLGDEHDLLLPDLRRGLVGHRVGESLPVRVHFPQGYPVDWMATGDVVYAVDIKAARCVEAADPDDPAFLDEIGAETLDDVLDQAQAEWEAQTDADFEKLIRMAILHELQERLGEVELSKELVEAELEHRWNQSEGALLRAKQVPVEDQMISRKFFIEDQGLRLELVHGIRVTLALGALALEHGLRPTKEEFDELIDGFAQLAGIEPETIRAQLKGDEAAQAALGQQLLIQAAAEHVFEVAEIVVLPPEAEAGDGP